MVHHWTSTLLVCLVAILVAGFDFHPDAKRPLSGEQWHGQKWAGQSSIGGTRGFSLIPIPKASQTISSPSRHPATKASVKLPGVSQEQLNRMMTSQNGRALIDSKILRSIAKRRRRNRTINFSLSNASFDAGQTVYSSLQHIARFSQGSTAADVRRRATSCRAVLRGFANAFEAIGKGELASGKRETIEGARAFLEFELRHLLRVAQGLDRNALLMRIDEVSYACHHLLEARLLSPSDHRRMRTLYLRARHRALELREKRRQRPDSSQGWR